MNRSFVDLFLIKIMTSNWYTIMILFFLFYLSGIVLIFRSSSIWTDLFTSVLYYLQTLTGAPWVRFSSLLGRSMLGIAVVVYYTGLFILVIYIFLRLTKIDKSKSFFIEKLVFFYNPIIFLFILFFLQVLELSNYPNYVFSRLNINLDALTTFVLYNMILGFFYIPVSFPNYKGEKFIQIFISKLKKESISKVVIIVTIVILTIGTLFLASIKSVGTFLNEALNSVSALAKISYSYDRLMYEKYGKTYRQMVFIKNHLKEDDVLIHPPQDDIWPALGNQPFLRFFLYPRILVSGDVVKNFLSINRSRSNVYILYTTNSEEHWPIVDTRNKVISFPNINQRDGYSIDYNNIILIKGDENISLIKLEL